MLVALAEGPAHPYAVAQALRRRGLAAAAGVNAGALYRCFRGLAELGWLAPLGVSREGGRPERQAYELTPLGRSALRDQLRALLAAVDTPARLASGLAFLGLLTPEEAVEVLRERAWSLQRALRTARLRYRSQLAEGRPRGALLDLEYRLAQDEGEVVWLRQLVADIESGELAWGVR